MSGRLSLTYEPGEVPPFALCESIHASGTSRWHIRRINPATGLLLTGGIDTESLCGRVKRGWDLRVRIQAEHIAEGNKTTCEACRVAYIAAIAAARAPSAVDPMAADCSRCSAVAGQPCRSVGPDAYARGAPLRKAHAERYAAARAARKATP